MQNTVDCLFFTINYWILHVQYKFVLYVILYYNSIKFKEKPIHTYIEKRTVNSTKDNFKHMFMVNTFHSKNLR